MLTAFARSFAHLHHEQAKSESPRAAVGELRLVRTGNQRRPALSERDQTRLQHRMRRRRLVPTATRSLQRATLGRGAVQAQPQAPRLACGARFRQAPNCSCRLSPEQRGPLVIIAWSILRQVLTSAWKYAPQ